MKKNITIIFVVTIILTLLGFSLFVSRQPNDDILYNEMDGIIFLIMITPVLILETEIYNICIYIFTEEKKRILTFFKTFSLFLSVLFLILVVYSCYVTANNFLILPVVIFLFYVLLKIASLMHRTFGEK